jgi:acyl-coenzyme A synthetase/AMP-(fatty) acid ligase/acyl carrier protein
MIDHRGAVNTILDINDRFGVAGGDRVLALSSLTFDLSVWDIFGTLAAGGVIVMPRPETERDPYHWVELLQAHDVTVWNSVPALLQLLAEEVEGRGASLPGRLRLAMMSGDWIPLDLPGRLRRLSPALHIVSLGGATEASIWSIVHPIEAVAPHWTSIPYGRPLRNQTMHVLDERLAPCPDWVAGDLHIGGVGLALGYWRDEERTRASFITRERTGERLYRTGDRGRYWPDGTIEFLGRRDQQVKVQGYRVELGEIEAALARHPRVGQVVVAALGDRFEAKRLVAYIVPAKGAALHDTGEDLGKILPRVLQETLPPYMVPVAYVTLPALPMSANGKVDRKALPAPTEAAESPEYAAPRSPIERQLADLWSAVLSVDRVGLHDNFFELGGDSLMAIKLISRVRQELSVDLAMRRLFDNPTVAGLAEDIETLRWAARGRAAAVDAGGEREEGQV